MINNLLKRVGRTLSAALLLMLTVAVIDASAQTPTVTVNVQNVTVRQLLQAIEENSQYKFAYSDSAFDTEKIVSVNASNRSIASIISEVLPGVEADVRGRQILLRKASEKSDTQQNPNQKIEVKGVVISSTDNLPIPGVAVYVKGQPTIGVAANLDGEYSITVPGDAKTLVFESLGYDHKEVAVKDTYLLRVVSLVEQSSELEEVVVVGFGTQRKETLVGAIQAVDAGKLSVTTGSLTTSFAGNIAGLISYQTSGRPGFDGATYNIRGVSTVGYSSSALIVVDGVETDETILNNLPPESIESFSILKDATATALYGSRGANGVIIVTTKQGQNSEKMTINVSVENTFKMPTYVPQAANAVTYMEAYNEGIYNDAMSNGSDYTPFYSVDKIEGTRNHLNKYIYPDNDWYNMMFKKLATNQRVNFSVRGGTKNVTYFLNAAINNEGGYIRSPSETKYYNIRDNYQSIQLQSNVSVNMTSTTKLSVKLNTIIRNLNRPYDDVDGLFQYVLTCNPARFPAVLPSEEDDTYIRYGNNYAWDTGTTETNPYALLSEGYRRNFYFFITPIITVDQDLKMVTPGLSASVLGSFYCYSYSQVARYITPTYFRVDDDWYVDDDGNYQFTETMLGTAGGTYPTTSVGRTGYHRWNFQGKLNYARTFNKHDVAADLIFHMQSQMYDAQGTSDTYILPYRQMGLAGRVTYNYDLRYFIEGDFGYNGSENFAKGHRWGFFPSVAIGWNLANEPFMSGVHDKLNTLKLRASYGQSGNDSLSSRFPYFSTVNTGSRLWYFGTGFSSRGSGYISVYGNEDATWEVANKFNVGFDLEIFKSLNLTADYFYEYRYNIFLQRNSLAAIAGMQGSTPYGNIGICDNRGVDMTLEYNKQFNRDWVLQVRGTFTYAHSRVLDIDEPDYSDSPNLSKVGHPINAMQVLVAEGLFTSQEEIDNSPVQDFGSYTIGDIKYKDVNGDGIVDSNDFVWTDKPSRPEIEYGFGATLRYRNWDLSFMFQGTGNYAIREYGNYAFGVTGNAGYGIMQYIVDDHWSYDNNVADAAYPRLSATVSSNNQRASTLKVHNGAYLRMKSAEIGYTYKFLRAYVSGSNLFYLSSFKLWDPEIGSGTGFIYPFNRTVTIGMQFNF